LSFQPEPIVEIDSSTAVGDGLLLVNLGTTEAPTAGAVRRYLAEFLKDRRVVDLSPWLWWPILYGVILSLRPARVAANYRKIWTDQGSPLLANSRNLVRALDKRLNGQAAGKLKIELAMTYGEPGIDAALDRLAAAGVRRLLVLPLFPQYSGTTTAAVFDRLAAAFEQRPWIPALRLVTEYHLSPGYLDALAQSVRQHWAENGEADRLLISFHGIPKRYHDNGDPYPLQCQATADALRERLGLDQDRAVIGFQSRFGREPWLEPYTDHLLKDWGRQGLSRVDVICPGFSADCLETLEEIAMENRDFFQQAGGGELRYIPALNDRPEHVEALCQVIDESGKGWPEFNILDHEIS
jgi:ferrochelatase